MRPRYCHNQSVRGLFLLLQTSHFHQLLIITAFILHILVLLNNTVSMQVAWRIPPYGPVTRFTETDPLFVAAYNNDLDTVKYLLESNRNDVNKKSPYKDESLLHRAVRDGNGELVDYLLSFDELQVDITDAGGKTPLFDTLINPDEDIFVKLLNKGAQIDHQESCYGNTVLHKYVVNSNLTSLKFAKILIDRGLDINLQNDAGETPIYCALGFKSYDMIYMLLYYGADVTICCKEKILPIAGKFSVDYFDEDEEEMKTVRDILFEYVFDSASCTLHLETLTAAMTLDSDLFKKIINHVSDVKYNVKSLRFLNENMIYVKGANFRLFVKKFRTVIADLLENSENFLADYLEQVRTSYYHGPDVAEILQTFFEHDLTALLIENCADEGSVNYGIILPLVHTLILDGKDKVVKNYNLECVTGIICVLLTYGFQSVTSDDLDYIFRNFGYCELFRILIRLEFKLHSQPHNQFLCALRPAMSVLSYDPNLDLGGVLDNYELYVLESALDYFVLPRLTQICLKVYSDDGKVLDKIAGIPKVPVLVELARNVARSFIIKTFEIKNVRIWFDVLHKLPVGEKTKKILSFESRLYNI